MELVTIVLGVVFTVAAAYILVQQLPAAGRHESPRGRFIAGTSFSHRRSFAKLARAGVPIEGAEDAEK